MVRSVGNGHSPKWSESLGLFLREMGDEVWTKVGGVLTGLDLFVRWGHEVDVPIAIDIFVLLFIFSAAVVNVYHNQRTKASDLEDRVQALSGRSPNIEFGPPQYSPDDEYVIFVFPTPKPAYTRDEMEGKRVTLRPGVWYVEITNRPTTPAEIASLVGASVGITIRDRNGPTGLVDFSIPFAHWGVRQVEGEGYHTLQADGVPHRLDVIAKYPKDGECYGVGSDAPLRLVNWRDPTYTLSPGEYDVSLTLRAVGLIQPVVRKYVLSNDVGECKLVAVDNEGGH